MILPDYAGGSIVNLMSSVTVALGAEPTSYPALRDLPADRLAGARNVVLLVIDGLGYEYLRNRGAGSLLHANLATRITSTFPPTTATAIPTFYTGLAPLQHGFTGWFTWFRELGNMLAVLPFRSRCGGALPAGTGIDPLTVSGQTPLAARIPVPAFVVSPAWIARSVFNTAFSGTAGIRPYETLEDCFTTIGKIIAAGDTRQYIHAYWPGFDALAHQYGVGSTEVSAHLEELDRALRKFVLEKAGSDTALIITADHGFIDTTPEATIQLADHPLLEETLVMPLCGEPRFAYCYVHSDRREQFESFVRSELSGRATLHRSRDLLASGCFGIGNAHPRMADRIGDYALEMHQNHVIKDWIPGEKPYRHIGVHGGGSATELHVPLIMIDL